MNNIQCHFCKRLCREVSTREGQFRTVTLGFNRAWQCDYHGVTRVWHVPASNDPKILDVVLVTIHKEQLYLASFFYGYDHPTKFRIDKLNRSPRTNETIISLEFYPEITPETIQQKLPTLILFS